MVGAPLGSSGSANKSGWMTETDFVLFLQHFIRFVHPSKDRKVLLLLDNHSSHLSIEGLDLAKEHGIIMLSFPPHCSHKLQPLDRSVFGPFKKFYNAAGGSWLRENPGIPMSILNIAGVVKQALPSAVTPQNIMSGFRVAGLLPFNRHIFTDDFDFAPAYVTDRDPPSAGSLEGPISRNDNDLLV